MRLKHGVKIQGIRPELILAMMIAERVYYEFYGELVITSVIDSKHSETSLHYAGCAFDCRTMMIKNEIVNQIVTSLMARLGEDFDVIREKDHIHIEYQPRR